MNWAEGIHRTKDGVLVAPRAVVPGLRGSLPLLVGQDAIVQGGIRHDGSVVLCSGVRVDGTLRAGHELVVGAACRLQDVKATGRIIIQEGAQVGTVVTAGDVVLLGACTVGDVQAGGDIVVAGEPRTGRLSPGGRITTRAW